MIESNKEALAVLEALRALMLGLAQETATSDLATAQYHYTLGERVLVRLLKVLEEDPQDRGLCEQLFADLSDLGKMLVRFGLEEEDPEAHGSGLLVNLAVDLVEDWTFANQEVRGCPAGSL